MVVAGTSRTAQTGVAKAILGGILLPVGLEVKRNGKAPNGVSGLFSTSLRSELLAPGEDCLIPTADFSLALGALSIHRPQQGIRL